MRLVLGFLLGVAIGFAWATLQRQALEERSEQPMPPEIARPAEHKEGRGEGREEEQRWLDSRPVGRPELAWLFGASEESLLPLGGSLVWDRKRALTFALASSGPVHLTPAGLVVLDGGRLLSAHAGVELARKIRVAGAFSVEAVLEPADLHHGGPARIVSLSFDGENRNFTLGQEGDAWALRLRTTKTGENGTNPEIRVSGLGRRRAHVVVTYDGQTERAYIDGKESTSTKDVAGSLEGWDEGFPLVVGNEAYDARDWAGLVRFIAFYGKALAPEEVAAASRALPPGDPPLGREVPAPPPKPERLPGGVSSWTQDVF